MKDLVRRPAYLVSAILVVGSFSVLLQILIWLTWPYAPLRHFDEVTLREVASHVVPQGEALLIHGVGCRQTDHAGIAERAFIDGTIYAVEPQIVSARWCLEPIRDIAVAVPHNLPPGDYRLASTLRFRVNPIREVVYRYETVAFTVTARTP